MRITEKYYSVSECALLLSLHPKTVVERLKAREFGEGEDGPVNLGTDLRPDYRVPASRLNEYLARRRVFKEEPGIAARSVGELRRKSKV